MTPLDEEIAGLMDSIRNAKAVAAKCAVEHPDTAAIFERKADRLVREVAKLKAQREAE